MTIILHLSHGKESEHPEPRTRALTRPTGTDTAPDPTPYLGTHMALYPWSGPSAVSAPWRQSRQGSLALHYKVGFCSSPVQGGPWGLTSPPSVHENWHFITSKLCMPPLPLQKKGRNLPFELRAVLARGVSSVPVHWSHFVDSNKLCSPALCCLVLCLIGFLLITLFFLVCEPSKWICQPITRSSFSR